MEFIDLSRYLPIKTPQVIPPFSELRTMMPVMMTHDLNLVPDEANLRYAESLAASGKKVVPIRRRPPFAQFQDRIGFPRRILLEMTSRCNFRCRMCPQLDLKRPRMDMPGSKYRSILDEIDTHGVEGLWLYNLGESLMHPEFRENVEHLSGKSNLGVIWMSTNGTYFDEAVIRMVLASNIDWVNFSAHAVTEETYKTVAPQGIFSKVQGNLETYYRLKGAPDRTRKPFIHTQMIEQETTRHEVDPFILKHHELADIVSVNMLEYVNLPNNAFGGEQRTREPLKSCLRVARNDCFVGSNGHVTLCDADYNGELFLGDVNEQSLRDIWEGEKRREILELSRQGRMQELEFCRSCSDYDI